MKKCNICGVEKLLDQYHKDKYSKDGKTGRCKLCTKEYDKLNSPTKLSYMKDYLPKYIEENKDIIKDRNKLSLIKHPQTAINYRLLNKDEISNYGKLYQSNNKEIILEKKKIYIKKRYENDPLFKLTCVIKGLVYKSLKSKGYTKESKTYQILGCTFEEFKLYIESLFEPWMNWENQGNPKDRILEFNKTWDIDHIIPLSSVITEEEIIKLNHYTNLQPLCSKYNREVKRNKL